MTGDGEHSLVLLDLSGFVDIQLRIVVVTTASRLQIFPAKRGL